MSIIYSKNKKYSWYLSIFLNVIPILKFPPLACNKTYCSTLDPYNYMLYSSWCTDKNP